MSLATVETLPEPRSKKMTFGDAEQLVREHGIDAMGETQLNIADLMLHNHDAFQHAKYPHSLPLSALAFSAAILRSTRQRLEILTGSDRLVTGPLHEEFRRTLSRLMHNHNGHARVIVVDGNATGFHELAQEFPNTLNVAEAHAGNPAHPPYHSMVNDAHLLRREAVHAPITDDTLSMPAQFSSNRHIAGCERKRMEALWDKLMGIEYPTSQPRKLWPWWPRKRE